MTVSDRAALSATYADFKLVKTRKVVQVIFELPLEQSTHALKVLGGMPNPAAEVWCAIARLELPPAQLPKPISSRHFHDMSAGQQAGILCREPRFWKFLEAKFTRPGFRVISNTADAAELIRAMFNVNTRADIRADDPQWIALVSDYRAWERTREAAE